MRALVLALVSWGCLDVPDGDRPMCESTSDCDSANGEVCDMGVCWGNPPHGPFAAIVSPPAERSGDLVSTELTSVPIYSDGWIDDIQLRSPVTYKGRIEAVCEAPIVCDNRTLGATIAITKPSSFAGGPGFRSVVTVTPGDDSFELRLPPSGDADAPYTVTVVPDGRDDMVPPVETTAMKVPPYRATLRVPSSVSGKILALGGIGLTKISGMVTTNAGGPAENYRVVALGHWDPDQPPTEVSTVAYTKLDGKYSLILSDHLVDYVEIVAKPFGMPLRPTLHLANVLPTQDTANKVLMMPPSLGIPVQVDVAVETVGKGGGVEVVSGARVMITSQLSTGFNASATLVSEGTTNDLGIARIKLLDGVTLAEVYRISIVPPASSMGAAELDQPYMLAPTLTKRLGTRVSLSGSVFDVDGKPVKDLTVTARPSVRFLWNLPPAPQAFVATIPPATATTEDSGEFALYVDPQFNDVWGHYDLVFEPTTPGTKLSRVPAWSQPVELPRDATKLLVPLPQVALPDASYVRVRVVDDLGNWLEGAEVKLYRSETNLGLCSEVRYEPASCPIPAQLVGRGAADDQGMVELTLPR
jgi:hypothetical protein